MAESVFWVALPMTVYGLLAATVPSSTRPSGRRARLVARVWSWLRRRPVPDGAGDLPEETVTVHPGPPDPDDPLAVLAIQVRLGILADHIRALDADERIWARGRKLEAAQAAYDALLDEACRLAGIPSHLPPADGPGLRRRTEPDRFEDELALAGRGWSW